MKPSSLNRLKKSFSFLVLFTCLTLVLFTCRPVEHFSEIPEIHYKSFVLYDTSDLLGNPGFAGILTFSFVDGDGDIGLKQPDTLIQGDSNYSNLFFTLFTMKNGNLVEVDSTELAFPLNYRIPYLEPVGKNLTLKGDIQTEFMYVLFQYDTLLYQFYLTDRAGHQSNTESTPLIILPNIQ